MSEYENGEFQAEKGSESLDFEGFTLKKPVDMDGNALMAAPMVDGSHAPGSLENRIPEVQKVDFKKSGNHTSTSLESRLLV